MNETPLFAFDKVSYSVGKKTILEELSFEVHKGEFLAVLGSSGAGKSSLLRLFNLLQSPTQGEVRYRGRTPEADITAIRRNVGFLFQSPAIFNGSIKENLQIAARWDSSISQIPDRELLEVLEHVELLHETLSKNARDLSGGEQQRLALARTLLNQPQVLLLDEPTASLDSKLAISIMDLVARLQQELQLSVIAVSHDHQLMRRYAQRVILLEKGKIRNMGSFQELDQQNAFQELGSDPKEQSNET